MMQWCTRAPSIEDDVALANIALDLLGQARLLLGRAGELEGAGRDEDALAMRRDEHEFHNVLLVELDNGDFAVSVAKLLCFSLYQRLLYERLSASADAVLAGVAQKAAKETVYHVDYAAGWVVRLGDGTTESAARMLSAVEEIWPYTSELFADDEVSSAAAADGLGIAPSTLREPWSQAVDEVLAEARLPRPPDGWRPAGGRAGAHTEAFGYLVGEMQVLHRAHPGASW
ncbi:1,2-phenylacetyl-CoA epoxidase subunit PaaC [Dactylosporangium sp. NPDC051484]|uniref:1,2-phenylacetyl-CoA epoxidase subunit PaaC n=1 Tax=Dactylosporangium sp. NPDC051484 TaxID=3154942 RepID=UPI0034500918